MCCLPCQSFVLRVEVPGPKSFFSYRSVRCYIYLISCVADPDPLHLACFYMFGIEYMYITYLHSSINHKVVSCLFQRWGEKNHNRKKKVLGSGSTLDPDPDQYFQRWIRGSGSTIPERWIRRSGSGSSIPKCWSRDPDPEPRQNEMDPQQCLYLFHWISTP